MDRNRLFQKNIDALAARDYDLAQRVRNTVVRGDYRLIRGETGQPNVLVKSDSEWIAFYDNSDPEKYAAQYIDRLNVKHAPLAVFLGLGLGYHLDYFMRSRGEALGTKEIVIFEKEMELFRLALEVGDFTGLFDHPHIHFFVGLDQPEEGFARLHRDVFMREYNHLRAAKIIPLPASVMLDGKYYVEVVETVKRVLVDIMLVVGNDPFDSFVGLENIFANLNNIVSYPGLIELSGRFKGRPGVLVAGGPSLNKNMHFLKGLSDRAVIMSCDSSLKPLMRQGIRPHLVTSIERIGGTELYYSGIEDFEGMYLVALPVLLPETIEVFRGRKFIAYRQYSHFKWLGIDKGALNCGMSVANLAFKILVELGCDPIILIGQDLAFGEEGDTHARGNVFGTKDERLKDIVMLEGNNGKPVKSWKQWNYMRLIYERDIAEYPGLCINSTEGGAKIRGAKIMGLKEAIEKHCKERFYPITILDMVYDAFGSEVDMHDEIKRIHSKTANTLTLVERSIGEFQKAVEESRLAEKEIIEPFLASDTDLEVDMERLLDVERRWLDLSDLIIANETLNGIMAQTIQAYDIWLANELSFLKDIYTDERILSMARVRKMGEWFTVIGGLLVFTKDALMKADKMLAEELRTPTPPIGVPGSG